MEINERIPRSLRLEVDFSSLGIASPSPIISGTLVDGTHPEFSHEVSWLLRKDTSFQRFQ